MPSHRHPWIWVIVFTLIALFLAVAVAAFMGPHDPAITLVVTGTSGSRFHGRIEVDGVPQEVTGEVPAEFRFRGSTIAYAVKRLNGPPDDQIAIEKFVNSQHCGGGGGRGGFAGGLGVQASGWLLFGKFPIGRVDANWWDAGIDFEDRDREILLSPDAGKIIWAPR